MFVDYLKLFEMINEEFRAPGTKCKVLPNFWIYYREQERLKVTMIIVAILVLKFLVKLRFPANTFLLQVFTCTHTASALPFGLGS